MKEEQHKYQSLLLVFFRLLFYENFLNELSHLVKLLEFFTIWPIHYPFPILLVLFPNPFEYCTIYIYLSTLSLAHVLLPLTLIIVPILINIFSHTPFIIFCETSFIFLSIFINFHTLSMSFITVKISNILVTKLIYTCAFSFSFSIPPISLIV